MSNLNTKRQNISIHKIKLNPFNPRIGAAHGMEFDENELSQENVKNAIETIIQGEDSTSDENISSNSRDSFRALKRSIYELGGIQYPIIIQKLEKKENDFEYIVLEGNTRLTIYLQYHDMEKDKEDYDNRWDEIPCEVVASTDKKFFHQYQLTAHIVPAKSWGPYERAKYLHHLKQKGELFDLDEENLIQICGGSSRRNTIEKEIQAYEHMQKWKDIQQKDLLDYDASKFQYFYQYQIKKNRFEKIGIDENEFIKHIGMDIIKMARHVIKLDQIWKNPEVDPDEECKKIYLDENSTEAFHRLDELKRQKAIVETNDILDMAVKMIGKVDELEKLEDRKMFLNENTNAVGKLEDLIATLNNFVEELTEIEKHL